MIWKLLQYGTFNFTEKSRNMKMKGRGITADLYELIPKLVRNSR